MKWLILCGLLLLSASIANAETFPNRTHVLNIIKEIKALQVSGLKLHKKYDFKSISDVKACVEANKKYRNQGKKLMQSVRDATIPMEYRFNLILAADAAFECVYCSENTNKKCSEVLLELTEVEKKL